MAQPPGAQPFFSPHEPPPAYCMPPSDSALAQRITKLAQFAARNGPSFVELMRAKQAGNPEYAYLEGGEGSGYWSWILYCTLYNLPPGQANLSSTALLQGTMLHARHSVASLHASQTSRWSPKPTRSSRRQRSPAQSQGSCPRRCKLALPRCWQRSAAQRC